MHTSKKKEIKSLYKYWLFSILSKMSLYSFCNHKKVYWLFQKRTSLKCILNIIKFTHGKCTIQWPLVTLPSDTTTSFFFFFDLARPQIHFILFFYSYVHTIFYNHFLKSILEHFQYPNKIHHARLQLRSFPLPNHLATTNLLSVSIDLPFLDISYEQNQTICGYFCLASFI
jgi:hypothetical protein